MPPTLQLARPVFSVDGTEQSDLSQGLLRMQIVETTQGLTRCEATFGNWGSVGGTTGYLYFDRSLLDFGKPFVVKAAGDTLFDGRIMALEASFPEGAPPEFTVLVEDRLQDLRMTRRTRTFEQASDADVIQQIANDHSLTPDVSLSGPTYAVLAQVNQSDLAFLRERARLNEAEIWVEGATLHVKKRSDRGQPKVDLAYGQDLLSFSVLADLATQRTGVTASGWDVSGKSAISENADAAVINNELNGDTSGASLLGEKLAARKESLVHTIPLTSDEARTTAESYYRMIARRFVTGRGTAQGRGDLRAGRMVDLTALGPLFSGKYYLTEVRHRFDSQHGYRVEFTGERPGLGQPS